MNALKRFDPLETIADATPPLRVLPDPTPGSAGRAATGDASQREASHPPAPGVIKKVSFGTLPTKKARDSKEYPVLDEPTEEVTQLAAQIEKDQREFDALEGALKANKAEIRNLTRRDYYGNLTGAAIGEKDANGLRIYADPAKRTGGVLILATSKYPIIMDASALTPLLGDRVGEYFKDTFEIKLKSDNLPDDPELQQAFVTALIALLEQHRCAAALEVTQGVKATKEFHSQRHKILDVSQNLRLDALCPFVAQVKSKGLKS